MERGSSGDQPQKMVDVPSSADVAACSADVTDNVAVTESTDCCLPCVSSAEQTRRVRRWRSELASECLCPAALWRTRCRRLRQHGCPYSHEVPPLARERYDVLLEARRARLKAENEEKVRLRRLAPAAPAPVSAAVERLRDEAVFTYDVAAHPLGRLVAAVLECAPDEALSEIHKRPLPEQRPLCPTLIHAFRLNGRKLPGAWTALMGPGRQMRLLRKLWRSEEYQSCLSTPSRTDVLLRVACDRAERWSDGLLRVSCDTAAGW
jgi:hypothetical protein